jgi:hypothetical protein
MFYNPIKIHSDPQNIFKAIMRSIEGTGAFAPFLSIMQHLLAIRQDPFTRENYFNLIDTVVAQIVLDGKGIDPDFQSQYHINIDQLLRTSNSAEVALLREEIEQKEKTLHHVFRQKCELEVRLLEHSTGSRSTSGSGTPTGESRALQQAEATIQYLETELLRLSRRFQQLSAAVSKAVTLDNVANDKDNAGNTPGAPMLSTVMRNIQKSVKNKNEESGSSGERIDKEDGHVSAIPPPPVPAPPPPPPPGQLRPVGRKAVHTPKIKLKPLQWQKLKKIDGSIWRSVTDQAERNIAQKLKDVGVWNDLENLFPFAMESSASIKGLVKAGGESSMSLATRNSDQLSANQKEISVIDAKKAYNLSTSITDPQPRFILK